MTRYEFTIVNGVVSAVQTVSPTGTATALASGASVVFTQP